LQPLATFRLPPHYDCTCHNGLAATLEPGPCSSLKGWCSLFPALRPPIRHRPTDISWAFDHHAFVSLDSMNPAQ
jgi:hypothetical protein